MRQAAKTSSIVEVPAADVIKGLRLRRPCHRRCRRAASSAAWHAQSRRLGRRNRDARRLVPGAFRRSCPKHPTATAQDFAAGHTWGRSAGVVAAFAGGQDMVSARREALRRSGRSAAAVRR